MPPALPGDGYALHASFDLADGTLSNRQALSENLLEQADRTVE
jgi:hypothetical protein